MGSTTPASPQSAADSRLAFARIRSPLGSQRKEFHLVGFAFLDLFKLFTRNRLYFHHPPWFHAFGGEGWPVERRGEGMRMRRGVGVSYLPISLSIAGSKEKVYQRNLLERKYLWFMGIFLQHWLIFKDDPKKSNGEQKTTLPLIKAKTELFFPHPSSLGRFRPI